MTKYISVFTKKLRMIFIILSVLCLVSACVSLRQFVTKNNEENAVSEEYTTSQFKHRVLLLSSYTPLYYTYEHHIAGLNMGLYPNAIDYDVIFMDAKRYSAPEDMRAFHDFLQSRLSRYKNKYDGILIADDDALEFAIRYQNELFEGLPIVFFGANNYSLARKAEAVKGMAGFYENDYTFEMVEMARKLMPERTVFYGVHDRSAAGIADKIVFDGLPGKYRDCEFHDIDITKIDEEEFIKTLQSIPEDAVCLFMTCFTNGEGHTYSVSEMNNMIVSNTKAPIIRNIITGHADGVLCSVAISFEEQCKEAGILMSEVIDGKNIDFVALDDDTPYTMEFDYNLLMKYGISISDLPENSVIYDMPKNIWDEYGDLMPIAGMTVLSLIFMIMAVSAIAVHEKKVNLTLRESNERIEKSQERLRYQADHDELLDIINRRCIVNYMKNNVAVDEKYSILMLDIDNFKDINEIYGHQFADDYLKCVTSRIKQIVDEREWMLARYGGDEFIVFVPGEILGENDEVVSEMLTLFRMPISLGTETIVSSCSIGISSSDGVTRPELHIIYAEIAMYEAKNCGKNRALSHSGEMKKKVDEENAIKAKLLDAMENDGFYMVYQPQINAITKEVTGFEALVRMYAKGMYPGVFIPIAEKSGWINRIGRITTELVVKQLAKWRDEGKKLYPISINFSRNQVYDADYVDYLKSLLDFYDIPVRYIEIEVTEGLFLERTQQADKLFKRFLDMGIKLHMDDFGTGYSSLGYLTYIPVDVVKLDKSLVDAYLVEGKDAFIRDVIQLVHDLDKVIIIEGVEEKWQYERLKEFNADIIQGYYFSKPIEPEEAIVFSAIDK